MSNRDRDVSKLELKTLGGKFVGYTEGYNGYLVYRPTDKDFISGKWVYKVKLGPSGQVNKYKARYVAKSYKQEEGLDYSETFGPTCKSETFRIPLQLSAEKGHVIHQFDIKTVFPHSPIEEQVYLEQPQELVKQGLDIGKIVRRLKKKQKWF